MPIEQIVGSTLQTAGSMMGQQAANIANQELQMNQLNWNENMWHQQNAYNHPAAQMQRMQEAGLHPMLALEGMGGGNAGSPAASEAPAQMENTMQGFDPIGNFMRLKQSSADIENKELLNEQQISKNEYQELLNAKLKQDTGRGQLEWKAEKYDFDQNRTQTKIRTMTMMAENLLQNQGYKKNAIEMAWIDWEKTVGTLKGLSDIRAIDSKIKLNEQEWQHIKDNGYKIPNKILGGLFTKYVMGTMPEKIKENKGLVLKSINEVIGEAIDTYWKDYDPGEQRKKDWRTKPKIFKGSYFPPQRPGF